MPARRRGHEVEFIEGDGLHIGHELGEFEVQLEFLLLHPIKEGLNIAEIFGVVASLERHLGLVQVDAALVQKIESLQQWGGPGA